MTTSIHTTLLLAWNQRAARIAALLLLAPALAFALAWRLGQPEPGNGSWPVGSPA